MILDDDGGLLDVYRFYKKRPEEIYDWFLNGKIYSRWNPTDVHICMEKIAARGGTGCIANFKKGRSAGFLHACCLAIEREPIFVLPTAWQTEMECLTKGKKVVTRERATALFPGHKWTDHDADAVLIAEFCRRTHES